MQADRAIRHTRPAIAPIRDHRTAPYICGALWPLTHIQPGEALARHGHPGMQVVVVSKVEGRPESEGGVKPCLGIDGTRGAIAPVICRLSSVHKGYVEHINILVVTPDMSVIERPTECACDRRPTLLVC
jgi:hypothetical protein